MKFPRLAAFIFILAIAGCDKEPDSTQRSYSKTGVPLTAASAIPSLPTTGSGTLDFEYTPVNKSLNYKLTWSNLTDSVIAIRVNGPAPAGYNAVNTTFSPPATYSSSFANNPATTPHAVLQEFVGTATKALHGKNGSFSGNLFVDGVKIRDDLLREGMYYFTIHTKTIVPPGTSYANYVYRWFGELRAQIVTQ